MNFSMWQHFSYMKKSICYLFHQVICEYFCRVLLGKNIFFLDRKIFLRERRLYMYLMYFSFIFFYVFFKCFYTFFYVFFKCLFLIQVYSYKSILLYIRGLFLLYLCWLYYIVKLYIISFNESIMSGTSRCKCPCSWKQSLLGLFPDELRNIQNDS